MNPIPKKITPVDLKRDGVYFKILKSGKIKTRKIVEFYRNERYDVSCKDCVRFTENGKKERIWYSGEYVAEYFHSSVLAFCCWADGVVEP